VLIKVHLLSGENCKKLVCFREDKKIFYSQKHTNLAQILPKCVNKPFLPKSFFLNIEQRWIIKKIENLPVRESIQQFSYDHLATILDLSTFKSFNLGLQRQHFGKTLDS
jgi:hypothetical protein